MSKEMNVKNKKKAFYPHGPEWQYIKHRDRLKNIKHKSDPIFMSTDTFLKSERLIYDRERYLQITRDNVCLVSRIAQIFSPLKVPPITNFCKKIELISQNGYKNKMRVLREIEKENLKQSKLFSKVKSDFDCDKMKKSWKRTLHIMKLHCHYPLVLPELLEKNENKAIKNCPIFYFDLSVKGYAPIGRMIGILNLNKAPIAVKNFIDLLDNHKYGEGIAKDRCLKGSTFSKIFSSLYIQGGGINSTRELTQYNKLFDFEPENFNLNHEWEGTLSMLPNLDGKINSQFTISFKPLEVLNGKRVVFGRILRGDLPTLRAIKSYGTKNGKPSKEIEITDCGILKLNLQDTYKK